jgi:flagellar biosynthesis protein FlhF
MQVKKFEAPTIQEALDNIKRELGPEAIILQTKTNKKGFGLMSKPSVEVTAAISEKALQKKSVAETKMNPKAREALQKMTATQQVGVYDQYFDKHMNKTAAETKDFVDIASAKPVKTPATKKITSMRYADIEDLNETRKSVPVINKMPPAVEAALVTQSKSKSQIQKLEDELIALKKMLEGTNAASQASAQSSQQNFATAALQDAFDQLNINGVERRHSFTLTKKTAFELGQEKSKSAESVSDQIAIEIMDSIEVSPLLKNLPPKTIIALVGPTGVGKTTTVAKIASDLLIKQNKKVGLINLDHYKIAAFDQLGTYARIMNVPFRSVSTPEDLQSAIQDFSMLDIIIIDTTGRSQKDVESLNETKSLINTLPNVQTHLVMSCNTKDTELYDIANRFAIYRPQSIIMSKLDEASVYGSIYNLFQKAKLPISYFTTGQRVPEDIEEATKERIAALILDI